MLRQLVAEIRRHGVVPGQRAVIRWGGREPRVLAEIVVPSLAPDAAATRDTRLDGDGVAFSQGGDGGADLRDDAGGLVAEDHGGADDEVADAAVGPVVHVGAADAGVFDGDEDVVGGEGGDGTVFVGYFARFEEDEGGLERWWWLVVISSNMRGVESRVEFEM